ncbi:hypothetical protein AMECASPLE_026469 [Ameca splendens]|uniref:Uncharacterized protein n=1 Tax=Ameca splendens TaxID=208324 RepID=A0ABV0YH86_9TELE
MEREAVQRRSPPAPLVARPNMAVKPSPSSRYKKRHCGAPSCVSAGEEESPTAAAAISGAVTPLLAGGRVAASNTASSSATALSPRLAAAPCFSLVHVLSSLVFGSGHALVSCCSSFCLFVFKSLFCPSHVLFCLSVIFIWFTCT